MDAVEPDLFLSGAPGVRGSWWQPFKAVVNVCDEQPPAYATLVPSALRLERWAFEDSLPAPRVFLQAAVLELADCRRSGLPTLVHCQVGQSRSPTVIALYWMGRDGIAWSEAIRRLRAARPQVDPHPLLTSPTIRAQITAAVQAFLTGDDDVLTHSRSAATALLQAHHQRGADGLSDAEGAVIEPGLACAARAAAARFQATLGYDLRFEVSARLTYDDAATIGAGWPEEGPIPKPLWQAAVERLQTWRATGRSVVVCCSDGKSLSVLLIAFVLMAERGWDFAAAMWYIRRQRRGAWPRPASLQGLLVAGE